MLVDLPIQWLTLQLWRLSALQLYFCLTDPHAFRAPPKGIRSPFSLVVALSDALATSAEAALARFARLLLTKGYTITHVQNSHLENVNRWSQENRFFDKGRETRK